MRKSRMANAKNSTENKERGRNRVASMVLTAACGGGARVRGATRGHSLTNLTSKRAEAAVCRVPDSTAEATAREKYLEGENDGKRGVRGEGGADGGVGGGLQSRMRTFAAPSCAQSI
jgi:hypothetical protein